MFTKKNKNSNNFARFTPSVQKCVVGEGAEIRSVRTVMISQHLHGFAEIDVHVWDFYSFTVLMSCLPIGGSSPVIGAQEWQLGGAGFDSQGGRVLYGAC